MKKKLICLFVFCIFISFTASDCNDTEHFNNPTNHVKNRRGIILYTTNSGLSWSEINGGVLEDIRGIRHFAFEPGTFNVIALDSNLNNTAYYSWKTTDFGQNWNVSSSGEIDINDIYTGFYYSPNKGFIVGARTASGESNIYMSGDFGSSWTAVQNIPVTSPLPYYRVEFGGSAGKKGIIIPTGGHDSVLVTQDTGKSWVFRSPVNSSGFLCDIAFIDDDNAIVCGSGGRIFMTTDLGISWQQIPSPVSEDLYSIAFYGDRGLIVGDNGTVIRSENGGLTWVSAGSSTSANLKKVIIGSLESWSCGDGVILRSFNDGSTWDIMRSEIQDNYKDISFTDLLHGIGFIAGSTNRQQ